MAYTKKTTTKAIENTNTDVAEKKSEKKKFEPTEMIPCVSLTAGELFYVGLKSDTLYTFADIDDVQEIEFRDLDYAARKGDKMMFKPRFVVQDADFIAWLQVMNELLGNSLHLIWMTEWNRLNLRCNILLAILQIRNML